MLFTDGEREVFILHPYKDEENRVYSLEMPEGGVKAVNWKVGAALWVEGVEGLEECLAKAQGNVAP